MRSILPFLAKASLAVALLAAAIGANGQRTTAVKQGAWGGTGMIMTVARAGATIQFDCATGSITKQLRMRKNGTFEAVGTFTRSGPGPVRIDRDPQASGVTYKGKVSGKKMTVTVTDAKTGEDLGTFPLIRGGSGRLHRCY